jgi:hypothetical protein
MKSKMQRRNKRNVEPLYGFIGERAKKIKRNGKEIGEDVSY